jgi:hypothetical protein
MVKSILSTNAIIRSIDAGGQLNPSRSAPVA